MLILFIAIIAILSRARYIVATFLSDKDGASMQPCQEELLYRMGSYSFIAILVSECQVTEVKQGKTLKAGNVPRRSHLH